MIDKKRLLENIRMKYPTKTLVEHTFTQLNRMSDPARKARSRTMTAFYKGITQGPDGNARTIWEVPSQTESTTKYNCVVEIDVPTDGGLFTVAKGKWEPKKFSQTLSTSDVKVWCSCKDFYWSGMKYNLGPNGKIKGSVVPNQNAGHKGEQTVVNIAPNKRDPEQKQVMCKHLMTVFSVFPNNAFSIMSSAKKFDPSVKVNTELQAEMEKGGSALAEHVEMVDAPKEMATTLLDSLNGTAEQLQKNVDGAGTDDIIDQENEDVADEDVIDNDTEDIIEEENQLPDESDGVDEVEELIDDENETTISQNAENGASELIDDENEIAVDADEDDSDVSDVLDTWNEMAKNTINTSR